MGYLWFNALPIDGPVKRPDLLIVGAAAAAWKIFGALTKKSSFALSQISHSRHFGRQYETDTTLIDFALTYAPTPTGVQK